MFKALIPAVVIALALAAPSFAFAQSNAPVTRAQVRGELVQLEQAGYNPASDRTQYPANIQAAEQRVTAQDGVAQSSFGSSVSGTSASGAPVASAANPVDYNRP
jgi:multidrug resistance efflux pump